MKYFKKLDYLHSFDNDKIMNKISELMSSQNLMKKNQICLTVHKDYPYDLQLGCGSLTENWKEAKEIIDGGKTVLEIPKINNQLYEEDFQTLSPLVQNSIFEDIFNNLSEFHKVGRYRIMNMAPKTCYSWHRDRDIRLHYVVRSNMGCRMIIDDEVCKLEEGDWYYTETTTHHTFVNGGRENRIHLVFNLLDSEAFL